ncbi:hypothetical protein BD413DRAFT_486754 [Trametes elegans]|nr:hypothetical protein BD413DRAFT_486754 [Trametes elegans]
MPSLRLVRQVSSKDIIAGLITGLEALQEVSDSISAVPFLGSIVSAALGIAKTVERIRGDRERYVRLARRVSDLSRHVHDSVAGDPHAMDENLKINMIELQFLLKEIRTDVECELRRKPLSRFLLQNSIAEKLEDRMDQLNSAWHSFDVCPVSKASWLALYDDESQLRLFRWSDLKCTRVRGKHMVSGRDVGQEWEGRWEGRAVVVRTVRPQCLRILPDTTLSHHPYVAQVIGLSHPSLSERFYVMDTGDMPLVFNQYHELITDV